MPQLVRRGKYTYGWSIVSPKGTIKISREALDEYGYEQGDRFILMPGSRRSRGFSVSTIEKLGSSKLADYLDLSPLECDSYSEGEIVRIRGKALCWVILSEDDKIRLPVNTLKEYSIKPRDKILAVRGSSLGIGFLITGPIIEEAKKHPELEYLS